MPNLTDLDVERVDAVDQPATRRRFLIQKDEAGAPAADAAAPAADPAAEIRALLDSATSTLGVIEKSASLKELDDDVADALDGLAKAAGVNPFAAGRKRKAPDAAAAAAAAGKDAAEKSADAPVDLAAVAAAFGEAVTKAMAPVVEGQTAILRSIQGTEPLETSRSAPPASGQPAGQAITKSGPRKLGDGMFEGIFHG